MRPSENGDDVQPRGSELLSHCPYCNYVLEGMPSVHRCPECGEQVDRRWRLFGRYQRSPRRFSRDTVFWMRAVCALVTLVELLLLIWLVRIDRQFIVLAPMFALPILLVLVVSAIQRGVTFVALAPRELVIVEHGRVRTRIPLEEIQDLRYGTHTFRFRQGGRERVVVLNTYRSMNETEAATSAFGDAVRDAIARAKVDEISA